jgi:hypothetical protein
MGNSDRGIAVAAVAASAATVVIHILVLAVAALFLSVDSSSASSCIAPCHDQYHVNGLTFFILLPEILLIAGALAWFLGGAYRPLLLGAFVVSAFLSVIAVAIRVLTHAQDIHSLPPGHFPPF